MRPDLPGLEPREFLKFTGGGPICCQRMRSPEFWGGNFIILPIVMAETRISTEECYIISFWDALILAAVESGGDEVLYTQDLNDGQQYGTVVARIHSVALRFLRLRRKGQMVETVRPTASFGRCWPRPIAPGRSPLAGTLRRGSASNCLGHQGQADEDTAHVGEEVAPVAGCNGSRSSPASFSRYFPMRSSHSSLTEWQPWRWERVRPE